MDDMGVPAMITHHIRSVSPAFALAHQGNGKNRFVHRFSPSQRAETSIMFADGGLHPCLH